MCHLLKKVRLLEQNNSLKFVIFCFSGTLVFIVSNKFFIDNNLNKGPKKVCL